MSTKVPWDIPSEAEIRWLLHQGFSESALMTPTLIRAANVEFLNGRTFDFDVGGERAFVLVVADNEFVVDFVAWEPKRGALATWRGAAFALGQEAIFNPASYFDGKALRVHRTPLEWLKAERDGIVIVQPQLTYAYLRDAPLSFADRAFAETVTRWREPSSARGALFIEVPAEGTAA